MALSTFAVDQYRGHFFSESSELPVISMQNSTKNYKKDHKSYFFSLKMASGNPEDEFLVVVWQRLLWI